MEGSKEEEGQKTQRSIKTEQEEDENQDIEQSNEYWSRYTIDVLTISSYRNI